MYKLVAFALAVTWPIFTGLSAVAGECFAVHGRVALYADGGIFLWPVGSKRMLDIRYSPTPDHDGSSPFMPSRLRTLIQTESFIFGDFEICPFEPEKPHEMRHVCIQSASHLIVRRSPRATTSMDMN